MTPGFEDRYVPADCVRWIRDFGGAARAAIRSAGDSVGLNIDVHSCLDRFATKHQRHDESTWMTSVDTVLGAADRGQVTPGRIQVLGADANVPRSTIGSRKQTTNNKQDTQFT